MDEKTCTGCGEVKPLDAYGTDRSRKSGIKERCKECRAARQREVNAGRRDQIAEYNASYYAEHREEALAYQAAYHLKNPHVMWAKGYRDRSVAMGHNPVVEQFTREDVLAEYGEECVYCGGPFEELDHFVPVSKGGAHTLANVRPSCALCNRRKGGRLRAVPVDWKSNRRVAT